MSTTHEAAERRFIRACWRKPVDCTPVWLMRQAGRYMPEYQALKAKYSFLEICRQPEIAAKATMDAFNYLKPDAAIIFSDIMIPALAMGLELDFAPGPKLNRAIQTEADVASLKRPEPAKDLDFVMKAIELTRAQLPDEASLIGFVGAPLTLAAYLAEGAPAKNWVGFKSTLYDRQPAFEALLERCVETVTKHALAQVDAGCDAIQLFDTNAGMLHPIELEKFALPAAARVIEGIRARVNVPVIYFARDVAAHLETVGSVTKADVLGIDWSVRMGAAANRLPDHAVMGNLDPTLLFASEDVVEARTRALLDEMKGRDGHIFNLGHGVLPKTPPPHARKIIETIRAYHGVES
ncbi:MAG: uroporphyrinogen decarboxylase [Myxococcota bacterium]|nr:uroporphyrinogen decarboxylase [Myxococcota bacterium]